jgi:hypothetical protein
MKAIVVEKYGPVENLVARVVPDAGAPEGRDLLIRYILLADATFYSG